MVTRTALLAAALALSGNLGADGKTLIQGAKQAAALPLDAVHVETITYFATSGTDPAGR